MKTFSTMEELAKAPDAVFKRVSKSIEKEDFTKDFNYSLGGDVILLESIEEVEGLPTEFDWAEELENFILLAVFTNNSGGPTYIVPKDLPGHFIKLEKFLDGNG